MKKSTGRASLASFERAVLAAALDPIVVIDHHGVIRSASDSVERVFGWSPGELVGQPVGVFIPQPHRSAHNGYVAAHLRTGRSHVLGRPRDFEAVRRDGRIIPIELCVSRADIPDEEMPVFVGIMRDVSRQRRAEIELNLVKTLALAVGSAPTLDEAMRCAISAICGATGWDHGEAWLPEDGMHLADVSWTRPGVECSDFAARSAVMRFRKGVGLIGRVWKTGRPELIPDLDRASDRKGFSRMEEARRAGFRSVLAVPIKAAEEVAAVLCFLSRRVMTAEGDLTALVHAGIAPLGPLVRQRELEDALRRSESEFRTAFQLASVGQAQLETQRLRLTRVNSKFCEIVASTPERLVDRPLLDLVHPRDRRGVRDSFLAAAHSHAALSIETRLVRADGAIIWVHVSAAMIHDAAGDPYRLIAMVQDITERRQSQEQLAAHREQLEQLVAQRTAELDRTHAQLRMADRMASIGTLAAGLGHDMNNVLLPVRARLNALRAEPGASPAAQRHTEEIRRSVAYLQQLADGLHFLALDPDRRDTGSESTDLAAWWEQAGVLLAKAAPRHVKVTAALDAGLPHVAAPAHALTQAVLNLIVNAGEAIPADRKRVQGRIRIRAQLAGPGPRAVLLSVADNGRGMTPEVQRRAFEMFYTTKTRGMGTGLGLALVRQVAIRAGGSVDITTRPGKGTTVTMTLPAAKTREGTAACTTLPALVSLDDARSADLVTQILRASGAHVLPPHAHPGDARLWVAAARDAAHAARWASADSRRGAVIMGVPALNMPIGNPTSITVVKRPDDFEEVRAALVRVLATAQEESHAVRNSP